MLPRRTISISSAGVGVHGRALDRRVQAIAEKALLHDKSHPEGGRRLSCSVRGDEPHAGLLMDIRRRPVHDTQGSYGRRSYVLLVVVDVVHGTPHIPCGARCQSYIQRARSV